MDFTQLHHQNSPLLIANVWDVSSARAAQQAGYRALGTSSAAIAAMLGYEDGEFIPFDELLYIVSRIKSAGSLPLTVDIEAGYGQTASEIVDNIKRLIQTGVVGINIEDSLVAEGVRQLISPALFATRLQDIRSHLMRENLSVFINVRTDTYLLNHPQPLQETLLRGQLYQQAGADGLFVPCLTAENEMAVLSREIILPLNVMCMPDLPRFDVLWKVGVKRISMGNFVHGALQSKLEEMLQSIGSQQSFSGVFH
ncbi:isocitrate lyase/phosphoenolpyruvate mutase family protein [uncultured Cedecea sp.]|uniref:isocitrate lyase/PEP mutase family protein n=1 Tax=uncultured Cedecea sp. TaxID=988762 RepID=UPI002626AD6B|nr:isocitrate lyase/phosphoenolpyruvate mutase family protein [uncultured Cedecea sp.]